MGVLTSGPKIPLPELLDYVGKAIKYGAYKLRDGITGLRDFFKTNEIDAAHLTDDELQSLLNQEAKQRGLINAKIFTPQSDGKILSHKIENGKLILEGHSNPMKTYDFIIAENGNLAIGHGHFKLSGNADYVKGAGQIRVTNEGKIWYVDDYSGHYKPDLEQLDIQFDLLNKMSILESDCDKVTMW